MSLSNIEIEAAAFIRSDLDAVGFNPKARSTLEGLALDRTALVDSINETRQEVNAVEAEPIALWEAPADTKLTNARLLAQGIGITLTPALLELIIALADSGVTAGNYGSGTKLVTLSIDAKGRITNAIEIQLNSDNVTEGVAKLFFTQARARNSLSSGSGINYNSATGVIATTGFTGSGAYTNFDIVNGIIVNAS